MAKTYARICALLAMVLVVLTTHAGAQEKTPHLGYVYPAGGSRDTTVTVTVGGQYLSGARESFMTGTGVEAKVVRYWKPPSRGQLNQIAQRLRELRRRQAALAKKKKAATKKGTKQTKKPPKSRKTKKGRKGKGASAAKPLPPEPKSFGEIVTAMGFKTLTMKLFEELRRKDRDPKRQLNPQLVELVTLRIIIDSTAPLGPRELRLRGGLGFSNPIAFHVGQWKEFREKEPNDDKPDGRVGKYLPVMINGQIMPGDVDRFSFFAPKGMRLVAATSARELIPYLADAVPGWFQATLTLYDQENRQVAYVDDFLFHPDPVLCFEIPAEGKYVLEIRDSIYRGREDFVYRIALGAIPYVTSIFPLGGRVGTQSAVEVQGWNLPVNKKVMDGRKMEPGRVSLSLTAGKYSSNSLPFAFDEFPEVGEYEPNGAVEKAKAVKLPMIVNGRIDQSGDRDIFSFRGHSGKQVVFEVFARRLGSPLDSLLMLTDDKGRIVATNDDHVDRGAGLVTHHADSRLVCKLPKAGTFFLHLVDAQHKGGREYGYRLHISRKLPDFSLRVVPSSINARPGQSIPMTAHALRRDYPGEIRLKLRKALPGFVLTGATIPANTDKIRFTLTVPRHSLGEAVKLSIQGQASIRSRRVSRSAVPAEDQMQAFLWRHLVTTEDLFVLVSGKVFAKVPLQRTKKSAIRIPVGRKTRVHFSGKQSAALKGVGLELNAPPKGISIGKMVPRREGGLTLTLQAAADGVKAGTRGNLIFNAFKILTYGGSKGQPLRTRRIPLGVLPAIPYQVMRR